MTDSRPASCEAQDKQVHEVLPLRTTEMRLRKDKLRVYGDVKDLQKSNLLVCLIGAQLPYIPQRKQKHAKTAIKMT